ncbi:MULTISPECIES: nucleotide exchange factor GrpE [unclassified Chamaesiphon]|uniref:nucleotide exchange factor GrpE n=1 Tax=unclassified Chamaesiphon TaxID=2620921 RepID=UPI00286ABC4F|nr:MULTISPECIES: nucleotide exchange factor GrpE [unclassified Chamaesiphon]
MSETPQQPIQPGDDPMSSQLPLETESPQPTVETVAATNDPTTSPPEVAAEGVSTNVDAINPPGATPAGTVEPESNPTDRSEVQLLTAKLAEISNQRDAFQSQYLRIAADFDNFRKRNSKEKEETELRAKQSTIVELLSVVDNFERARTQIKPQNDGELGIHKSYQGVYKQLVESLKRIGVSPMRPEGQQFDPNLHEAVMRQPTEEHPEGTVIEELQRGYYLGDRILRHSLVKVAAPPEQLSAEDATNFDAA